MDAETVLAKAGLRAGETIADLGCGTSGHFVIPAAKMVGLSGKVYAVDILKPVLAGVESRAKMEGISGLVTLWGDCEIPGGVRIKDGTLDLVLIINNLYQSKNRIGFLREASRLTKVGGRVVIIDWKTVASPLGPPAESRIAPAKIQAEATSIGLKFKESFEPGPYFWGLTFTK